MVRADRLSVHFSNLSLQCEDSGAGDAVTVLAEHAVPVSEIVRDQALQLIQDAKEDVEDAKDDEARKEAAKALDVAEARLQAVDVVVY